MRDHVDQQDAFSLQSNLEFAVWDVIESVSEGFLTYSCII